jgi:hypothetical protein
MVSTRLLASDLGGPVTRAPFFSSTTPARTIYDTGPDDESFGVHVKGAPSARRA